MKALPADAKPIDTESPKLVIKTKNCVISALDMEPSLYQFEESRRGYFMPFIGQANPLNNLPLVEKNNEKFERYMERNPFEPEFSPAGDWIAFNEDLREYLDNYMTKDSAISEEQFKSLLADHLGDLKYYHLIPAKSILDAYQSERYRFNEAVQDFWDFLNSPCLYLEHDLAFGHYVYLSTQIPRFRLLILLYHYPKNLRSEVFSTYSTRFDLRGYPRDK